VSTIFDCSGFQCGGSASIVRHRQLNAEHWLGRVSWIALPLPGVQCLHHLPADLPIGNIVDFAAKRAVPAFSSGNDPHRGPQSIWAAIGIRIPSRRIAR
jgi:hypothetical protein